MSKFNDVYALNVNEKTEKKGGLKYLSWAWAWAEFVKFYPDATYEVIKFEGKPYYADEAGAMCYTKVTANGLTHEMWLPVMDSRNKALKAGFYTMFDVNKTIMRCLTKNLAMFGLGLYIYAGEDLPEDENQVEQQRVTQPTPAKKQLMQDDISRAIAKIVEGSDKAKILTYITANFEYTQDQFNQLQAC